MAISPSHQFGQIIGDVLEATITPLLEDFAKRHCLYLDKKGRRPCRAGLKCSWLDLNQNVHDLDFVLERGGTPEKRGTPVAFIETAWRRYTKHSRNKAQEIQGAILPLVETYRHAGPFIGAVLAGVYTEGALNQLKSLGFIVLFFPYRAVVDVFQQFNIDAVFDEETSDAKFKRSVRAYKKLSAKQRLSLSERLLKVNDSEVQHFLVALAKAVSRQIERILVLPLHGMMKELTTVTEALQFVESYDDTTSASAFQRFEIQIRYNNGDSIEAKFGEKGSAIGFLRGFAVDTTNQKQA